jgi:putative acetyltransferase
MQFCGRIAGRRQARSKLSSTAGPFPVWTAWADGTIAGIAALLDLGNDSGEIKSMRTHPDFLRGELGTALIEHIIAVARTQNYRRLSLETGSGPAFDPALAPYRKFGFVSGETFADYTKSEFNQFFHLAL